MRLPFPACFMHAQDITSILITTFILFRWISLQLEQFLIIAVKVASSTVTTIYQKPREEKSSSQFNKCNIRSNFVNTCKTLHFVDKLNIKFCSRHERIDSKQVKPTSYLILSCSIISVVPNDNPNLEPKDGNPRFTREDDTQVTYPIVTRLQIIFRNPSTRII